MSENVEVQEEVVELTPAVSPDEDKALASGWVPKDKWVEAGNDESTWRTAREFNERGELFNAIHSTKRELRQTQATLTALQKHHNFVFEKAYQKARDELKKEKRQAIRMEDFERVEELDNEIEQLDQNHVVERTVVAQVQTAASQTGGVHPDFQAWQDRNTWYNSDQELHDFAEAAGMAYFKSRPSAQPADVLKHVEATVKKAYPEKFGVRKTAPNPVASNTKQSRVTKRTDIELDDTEMAIMKSLVASGTMTEEQYIAELKKVK